MNNMMTKHKTPKGKRMKNTDEKIRQVMDDFRVAYADVVILDMTNAQFAEASRIRQLTWTSPHRLSLADAVRCYDQMAINYNEFHPGLLRELNAAFGNDAIIVTPSREYSVAVYLHVPDAGDLRQRVERFAHEHFNADEVYWTKPGTLRVWWD